MYHGLGKSSLGIAAREEANVDLFYHNTPQVIKDHVGHNAQKKAWAYIPKLEEAAITPPYQATRIARMIQTNMAPPIAATMICPIIVVGKRPTIEANQPPITPPISPITKSPIKPNPRPLAIKPASQPATIPTIIQIMMFMVLSLL
jgi:hypothetical protein